MLHLYRRLLALRRLSPALREGTLRQLPVPEDVVGYERRIDDERIVVLVNFAATPTRVDGADGTLLLGSLDPDADRPFDGTLAPDEAVIVRPNGRS
jgi:glycosidase